MNKEIQPKVHTDCVVTCACGNSFTTASTQASMTVEICSACHPFYTGQQKFVDTEGRIDKFKRKQKISKEKKIVAEELKKTKMDKKEKSKPANTGKQPSLKEMLEQARSQGL